MSQTKRLFLISSKTAPCISFGSAEFWKSIENHNRCNEREIGKLKDLLHRRFETILHEETRQIFVYVHTYVVAPVDVFFVLLLYSFRCFCFSNRPREVKNFVAGSKISAILKLCTDVPVPLGAKEHPQMDLSSSINAGQRVMRCPICCFRSKTV